MGFCINCDNRHGCKSDMPACLELMKRAGVKDARGKTYLKSLKKLDLCEVCSFFRSCWRESEYRREISAAA